MNRRRGYALLILLLALATLASSALLASLRASASARHFQAQRETRLRLQQASQALVAHAAIEDNTPGSLPSPSAAGALNGDSSPAGFTGQPGQSPRRLPWRFLALDQPLDGDGECLWYALDGHFRNNLTTAQRSPQQGTALNTLTQGALLADGQPAVAILLAPGPALAGQQRGEAGPESCRAGAVEAFLDGANAGTGSAFASLHGNDLLQPLTAARLLRPLAPRVLRAVSAPALLSLLQSRQVASGAAVLSALRGQSPAEHVEFDAALSGLPAAQLVYGSHCPGVREADGSLSYRRPVSWLCFNDWYAHLQLLPDGLALADTGGRRCTLAAASRLLHCTRT